MSVNRPQSNPSPTDRETDSLSVVAGVLAVLVTSILVGTIATVVAARGEEAPSYHFNLYAADRGAGESAMRFKVQVDGPGPLVLCYVIGAISVEALIQKHPDKDFMGGCQNGELLTLREITDRALALLPAPSR